MGESYAFYRDVFSVLCSPSQLATGQSLGEPYSFAET